MSKLVLVKNISFNDNKPFELSIPHVYSYDAVASIYLRTAVFNAVDFDCQFEELEEDYSRHYSDDLYDHFYDVNLFDDNHDLPATEYIVTVCCYNTMLLYIDDDHLSVEDDIKQLIFEIIRYKLPMSFIYSSLK